MYKISSNKVQVRAIGCNSKTIYTFFHDGFIVELPTRWLRHLSREPRYSPLTVKQYAGSIKDLLDWFLEVNRYGTISLDNKLKIATRLDLQHWIKDRKAARIKGSTMHSREAAVKALFEWLTSEDGTKVRSLENTPYKTGKLISPSPSKRKPRYLTTEDTIRLLGGYHNESERCLVHTLYDTGLRISEAMRLRKCDLPNEQGFPDGLKYYPLYVQGSKGRGGDIKERIALISSPVLARIRRYHNSSEYRFSLYSNNNDPNKAVFLSVNGRELSNRAVSKQMKCAAVRAGLDPRYYSPHKFRHGAAFSILTSELGKDYFDKLLLVQQLFGHSNITTTEIYTAIPPVVLAKLNNDKVVTDKYQESKRIYEATYLPLKKHVEKRGHRK
jgi:integrase/recombinase XerD